MNRDNRGRFSSSKWFAIKFIGLPVLVIALGLTIVYMYQHPKIVTNTVTVTVVATSTTPVIDRIMKCESGNNQYDKNGQVLMMANQNGSVDVGIMQINVRLWGAQASKLGYNLTDEKDNRAFGKWLYANYGTEPWIFSKPCWNK